LSIFKLFVWTVIFYPATVLHEIAHAVVAKIFGGSVVGFSLTPIMIDDRIVLSRVIVSHRLVGLNVFSSLSPLVWWVLAFFFLEEMGLLSFAINNEHLVIAFNLAYKEWGWDSIVSAYGIAQLLWAGKLSRIDVIASARALLSPSGALIIFVLTLAVYVFFILSGM